MIRPIEKWGGQKSKDQAVWQYLLDHANVIGNFYKITLLIRNRGDWESRIKSRMAGKFRTEEKELLDEIWKLEQTKLFERLHAEKIRKTITAIRTGKCWHKKILLRLHFWIKQYLFGDLKNFNNLKKQNYDVRRN